MYTVKVVRNGKVKHYINISSFKFFPDGTVILYLNPFIYKYCAGINLDMNYIDSLVILYHNIEKERS